jgi:hypothetical protein
MNSFTHLIGSSPQVRFQAYIVPVTETGCWLWLGEYSHNGYGRFRLGNRRIAAHRHAWELDHGPIPDGLMACHKCDTPSCVNPSHLFLGTCKQNKQDSVRKGRHSHGKKASDAMRDKLCAASAMQIFLAPGTHQFIADRYGVSRQVVTGIKAKTKWVWIHNYEESK